MRKENWLFIIVVAVLAGVLLINPNAGHPLRIFLQNNAAPSAPQENKNDVLENLRLKAELAKLEDVQSQLSRVSGEYLLGLVYSDYPFNFKKELAVDVGAQDGVLKDAPVLFKGVLVGKVQAVFDRASLIMTVFDPRWRSAVRLGARGIDALVTGGAVPTLTLVDKGATLTDSVVVYSADRSFPHGLPLGETAPLRPSTDQLFQEADLILPYDIRDIRSLMILKNWQRVTPPRT